MVLRETGQSSRRCFCPAGLCNGAAKSVQFVFRDAVRQSAVLSGPEHRVRHDSLHRCGQRSLDKKACSGPLHVGRPHRSIRAPDDDAIGLQRSGTTSDCLTGIAKLCGQFILVDRDIELLQHRHAVNIQRIARRAATLEQNRVNGRALLRDLRAETQHLHCSPYSCVVPFSDVAAGRVLGGRYEVQKKIGEGDYGEVYEVFDMHLEIPGALKLLTKIEDVVQDGLWAEAAHLRRLDGEFILGVQNALFLEGVPTVVADFAERGSVADHIADGIGLPIGTSVRWLHQIARGLARVHDQGLLHRDIKPANVFVSAADNALLGDFGLVRIPNERGLAAAAGSTGTMAPEVAAAFAGMTDTDIVYSRRSDIYGLGATGWWMLAGEPLHAGADEHAILQTGDPDLWNVAPHVPRRIRDAINRALRVDPAARFASAAEFDSAMALRNPAAREWRRVPTEDGHLACFLGEGVGRAIRVCSSPAGRKVAIHARYSDSGRKLNAAGRTVPKQSMFVALRAVMVACNSSRR